MSQLKEFDLTNLEDDDTDSGSGSTGVGGFIEPVLDMALFGFAQAGIREGERRFGAIPDPKDPYVQGEEMGQGKRLRSHPILSAAAEFNGVDKSLSPNPKDYPDAEKNYAQLQNKLSLRASLQLGKSSAPSLRRT